MSKITAEVKAECRRALTAAAHGTKAAVAAELAAQFGLSVSAIYRAASLKKTPRARAGRKDYREWVATAVALSHKSPSPAPLDIALAAAIEGGLIPPEAKNLPLGTAYRIANEMGFRPPPRRTQRIAADYPQQALQFDGSTSQYIVVGDQIDEDDWQLKLHNAPTPASGYKNKPLAPHRMRLGLYAVWDICTGYRRAVYCVERGESAFNAAAALVDMLTETGDPARPMHGLPDDLWSDQGPLWKADASKDLLDRLGIGLVTGEAYRKERMGGVERGHRTQWARFERSLFLTGRKDWTLSEIRDRLAEFERVENRSRAARIEVGGRRVSRTEAWAALVRTREEPLQAMPANAISTMFRECSRKIDRNGIIRWDGVEYECPDWHSCWAIARQSMTEPDALTLELPTGERSVARRLQRRAYGEVKGVPRSALDKLLDEQVAGGADIYTPATAATGGNVIALRGPATAAAALDNPLDASRYPDIESAMAAFGALYPWPLDGDDHAAVAGVITDAGLSRQAVADLASSLLVQLKTGDTHP